ncbi:MAG: class I SAM-dependent methyltransferase [Chloroflexota bacterium]
MDFYDDSKNVDAYIEMAEGYDGRELIDKLGPYLPEGSTVLELGMGPGKDMDILLTKYQVTGSDRSQIFVDRYRQTHPEADLLVLDVTALDALATSGRTFDCIYSNKVLHHLTRDELIDSLAQQHALLNDGGLLCHAFWYGDGVQDIHGMLFTYYTEDDFETLRGTDFEIVLLERAKEMEDGDTVYVILRKHSNDTSN